VGGGYLCIQSASPTHSDQWLHTHTHAFELLHTHTRARTTMRGCTFVHAHTHRHTHTHNRRGSQGNSGKRIAGERPASIRAIPGKECRFCNQIYQVCRRQAGARIIDSRHSRKPCRSVLIVVYREYRCASYTCTGSGNIHTHAHTHRAHVQTRACGRTNIHEHLTSQVRGLSSVIIDSNH
jgi:hypothetical protein